MRNPRAFLLSLTPLLLPACGPREPAPVQPDTTAAQVMAHPDTLRRDTRALLPAPGPRDTSAARLPELPDAVLRTFRAACSMSHRRDPFPLEQVWNRQGRTLGYIVDTDSASTTERGYAGPVPLRLYFDSLGRPRRIYILDNCETPAYLEIATASGLLDRLLTYDPARPDSIDAVTLATSSSRAVIRGVTATAARVHSELRPER